MNQDASLPPEMDPTRYVEKISLVSGQVLDQPIRPEQLLVKSHRDYHVVDVHARHLMSKIVRATGSEEEARRRIKERRRLGYRASEVVARAIGESDVSKVSSALFGLKEREYYFRYKRLPLDRKQVKQTLAEMKRQIAARLEAMRQEGGLRLRVLLTGGTGFLGKEVIWQAARDPDIAEMYVVIRPKEVRDRQSGAIVETLSPVERGRRLLDVLWIVDPEVRAKFRFVEGDVEQPGLGMTPETQAELSGKLTHVVHCAASVAFDDPYEVSFRANVMGTLNALRFSYSLQQAPGSPFLAHLGIETSYIHGRQVKQMAREDEIVFPRNFYNNYYELTKAMASIETERFMLSKGLRVVQLCPAIVIGEYRAGNNRGDTKVVNAPVNLFGRAQQARESRTGSWMERSKASILASMACVFPGDPSAEINLITVDRVVAGIIAALKRPSAIGERIHLATDNRITSRQMVDIVNEELGAKVRLAEPTLHRTVTVPAMTKLLTTMKQDGIARVLGKLSTIFSGYSEWGQPIHEVGNDTHILGLELPRPNTKYAFRMLCRHNRYVQDFGKVSDEVEISRREQVWSEFILDLEKETGSHAGALPAEVFQSALKRLLDLSRFTRR